MITNYHKIKEKIKTVLNTTSKRFFAGGLVLLATSFVPASLDTINMKNSLLQDSNFPEYLQKHNGDQVEALEAIREDKSSILMNARTIADMAGVLLGGAIGTTLASGGLVMMGKEAYYKHIKKQPYFEEELL